MVANWMLQPSTIHTVPIALFLLGASMQPSTRIEGPQVPDECGEAWKSVASVPAIRSARMATGSVAGTLLLCNLLVSIGRSGMDISIIANEVARYGYSDPFVDDLLADEYRLAILDRDRAEMLDRAAWFANRAFARYPVHHASGAIGELAFSQGNPEAALEAELRALQLQPWNPQTHRRLLVLSKSVGDDEAL